MEILKSSIAVENSNWHQQERSRENEYILSPTSGVCLQNRFKDLYKAYEIFC